MVVVGTPKTHAVPFPEFLALSPAELMEGQHEYDLILVGPARGFMKRPDTHEGSFSWFLTALEKAGIDRLTPHDLRHTAASLAISSGAHVKAVQRMLGQKSTAMTLDTYADLFDDDLDAVAARLEAGARAANVSRMWPRALGSR